MEEERPRIVTEGWESDDDEVPVSAACSACCCIDRPGQSRPTPTMKGSNRTPELSRMRTGHTKF